MERLKKTMLTILIFTLIGSFAVTGASAAGISYGAGTVSATVLNIRSGPSTGDAVIGTVTSSEIVVIVEKANDDWYKVNYLGTEGYVAAQYVENVLQAENFSAIGTVDCDWARMRERPSLDSDIICAYAKGTTMDIIGINCGWYKVKYLGHTGYIRSDLMVISGGKESSVPTTTTATSASYSSLGRQIADFALQYVGYSYVYGEESPSRGFDCSGLVYYVYTQFGYSMSRTATTQYLNNGRIVEKSELQPGDLVFFKDYRGGSDIGHVGIYIGDGKFVHASTSTVGVIISELYSDNYTRRWYGAKRLVD